MSERIIFKLRLGQNVLEVGFDDCILAAVEKDRVCTENLLVLSYQVTE